MRIHLGGSLKVAKVQQRRHKLLPREYSKVALNFLVQTSQNTVITSMVQKASRIIEFKTNKSILTLQPASGYICFVCISARLVTSRALFIFFYLNIFLRPPDFMSQEDLASTKSLHQCIVRKDRDE
jgi:hypothetical protein